MRLAKSKSFNLNNEALLEVKDSSNVQASTPEEEKPEDIYAEELKIIKGFQAPKLEDIQSRRVFLGEKSKKYTLLLDLDETLILSRNFPKEAIERFGGSLGTIIRPYTRELLEALSDLYEIVIFTASCEEYAYQMTNIIDPEHKFIKKVIAKEHCLPTGTGYYVKDLRVIADRSLDEMLIADNSIISFAFQLANGITVSSYDGKEEDMELSYLTNYLTELYNKDNIVESNRSSIGLI